MKLFSAVTLVLPSYSLLCVDIQSVQKEHFYKVWSPISAPNLSPVFHTMNYKVKNDGEP